MAGQEAEVKVRLRAEGAEETKQRLLETRAALIGVSTDQLQNAQSMRQAARDATALNNAEAYQTRIFLAQHPALNTLTRGMKDFGNVSRGVLSITTAFSTAISAFNSTSSALAESDAEVSELQRHQLQAIKDFGAGSREAADATDELNGALARRHDLLGQKQTEEITNTLNLVAAIGMIGSNAVTLIPKAVQVFTTLRSAIIGTTVASTAYSGALLSMAGTEAAATGASIGLSGGLRAIWAALGPVGWIILGLSIAIPLLINHWQELSDAFMATGKWMQTTFGPAFVAVWNAIATALPVVWGGIKAGFVSFANGMIMGFNGMIASFTKGAELLANGVIAGINGIISAYNRLASALKLPGLPSLSYLSLAAPQIPLIAAANGADFMTNGPTMMLVGEAGQEHVQVTPNGRSTKSGGNTLITNVFVAGTVRADQDLAKFIDNTMKERLKRHGWT